MLTLFRPAMVLFVFAFSIQAQDQEVQVAPEKKNHVFFHPFVTVLSLAIKELPFIIQLTYERDLESPGVSFIWQPQIQIGSSDHEDDIKAWQLGSTHFLGLRRYFHGGLYKGFYVQGSIAGGFNSVKLEQTGNPDKVSGVTTGFGALGYLGYRWSHVFTDIGVGYQVADGTLTFSDGDEVEIAASGLALDINLGFGF